MRSITTRSALVLIMLTPALLGCGGSGDNGFIKPGEEVSALALWIWLAADQDTSVHCQGPTCTGGDSTFGSDPALTASTDPADLGRTYVQFTMPTLPTGSVVDEAYLELHQVGTPGSFGQELVAWVPVEDPWRPDTMTYNTQPRSFPGINQFDTTPSRNGSGWWTSPNLKQYADYKLANPQLNYGFVTTTVRDLSKPAGQQDTASYRFRSNNDISRTATSVGLAPRFVLRITLPAGATLDDVTLPPLAPGHDLLTNASGQSARALLSAGETPPSSWNVGAGQ
jgi:hypothetical protein